MNGCCDSRRDQVEKGNDTLDILSNSMTKKRSGLNRDEKSRVHDAALMAGHPAAYSVPGGTQPLACSLFIVHHWGLSSIS